MRPPFVAMRRSLVERGLLDAEFRLTAAGEAYCDRLLASLRKGQPTPAAEPVRWTYPPRKAA